MLLWAACALLGDGFIEADGCTHYLYARFALAEPHYLVNVWGRPLCTAIYALPAALGGRLGARAAGLGLALLCGWTAYRIALDQHMRRPALAAIFTWGMPLVFLHSLAVLTELPFAATLGLAFMAYQRRAWGWMALAVGLLPLGRPEGFGFLLLGGAALIVHRRWWWLALMALPLVSWDLSGWVIFGRQGPWWGWLASNWPYSGQSLYGRGYLLHFVALLPMLVSPLVFPMTLIGIYLCLRPLMDRRSVERDKDEAIVHGRRARVWIALLPVGVLGIHSLLHWAGKMASNGELRYLLVTAPLWGVLGAMGWEWAADRFGWRRPVAWAGAAVLSAGLINGVWKVLPPTMDRNWQQARQASNWYAHWPQRHLYPRLIATHPGLFYFLDLSPNDRSRTRQYDRQTVLSAPPGSVLIWDDIYGLYNATGDRSITLAQIQAAGWVNMEAPARTIDSDGSWHIFHSPRIVEETSSP